MRVSVRGEEQELAVSTVSLLPDYHSDALFMFRCTDCGGAVAKYQGNVTKIYPYYEPSDDILVAKPCRSCGKNYTFQKHLGTKHAKTKVILYVDNSVSSQEFHCFQDRDMVLRYSQAGIYSLALHESVSVPFFSPCPRDGCGIEYYFHDLLS